MMMIETQKDNLQTHGKNACDDGANQSSKYHISKSAIATAAASISSRPVDGASSRMGGER